MKKAVRSLILGTLLAAMCPMGSANAATDIGAFMGTIGVPNPATNDVLFFGWSPVVPPTTSAQLAELAVLNFGLAMYDIGGKLHFTFVNGAATPTTNSIITEFYFDDGSSNESGLYFNTPAFVADSGGGVNMIAAPAGNLPEHTPLDPDFDATDGLSWKRTGGANNGLNPLPEYLTVKYNYIDPAGSTPAYTFNDIVSLVLNGTVRVAMKVQGIGASGWSESVIWAPTLSDTPPPPGPYDPPPVVPVPGAAGLGLLGMALVGLHRRMRQGRKPQQTS